MAAFMLFKVLAPVLVLPVLYITGYMRIIKVLNLVMVAVVIWNTLLFTLILLKLLYGDDLFPLVTNPCGEKECF